MLCNIAASEFLMPIGSFSNLRNQSLDIDALLDLKEVYEVSTEALLLRTIKLTDEPCFVFFSSRIPSSLTYKIDYSVKSRTIIKSLLPGLRLPKSSCVNECIAIGYTSKGEENLPGLEDLYHIECVGIPPYPSHIYPRVAGVAKYMTTLPTKSNSIRYLRGDATKPRGIGHKIIAFIINDKALSWGAGFARVIQNRWPVVQQEFKDWVLRDRRHLSLGSVNVSNITDSITAFKMIAQHGYGSSPRPRIRYSALETCLQKLVIEAKTLNASVHMPRIGSGEAGGSWEIISEIIENILCNHGIEVTVYDLPLNKKANFRTGDLFDI